MVNTSRGDALVDERYLQSEARDSLIAELERAGVPAELRQISDGRDVAEVLEAVATELSADLIVIGLRRQGAVGKLILGSAATRILLTSTVPVMTVKAET